MRSDIEGKPSGPGLSHSEILNIVLVYVAFGALWILLSDKLMEWLFKDAAQMTLFSMIKGWLYVALTSILLYNLMLRWVGSEYSRISNPIGSFRVVLIFLALAGVIVSLTTITIVQSGMHHREEALNRLQTIADMKSEQISDWLRERQADADFVRSSRYLVEQYQGWRESGDLESAEHFKARLEMFCNEWRFTAITLLDPAGEPLWRTDKAPLTDISSMQRVKRQALDDTKALRLAPYRGTDNIAHLDFVSPLAVVQNKPPVVILHINLANWLFPMLKRWPLPQTSGEILLIRLDKNHLIYLNDLLPSKESSAKLNMPGMAEELIKTLIPPAGRVISNRLTDSLDYRGVPVTAVVTAVPETDWFLVAKMDRSELYDETLKDAIWIGSVGLLSLLMTAAGFNLVRQSQQLALSQALQNTQSERINALNLLANIAECSNDAIFAKDLEGRYILFNKAACNFVGKSVSEVLGHDDMVLFPAEQAEKLMAIGREVINGNCIQTQEEVLSTMTGERVFLATKGPLKNAEGTIIGIFGISRDITEMKQFEKSLRQSEERLRLTLEATRDGLWDWDLRNDLAYLSPRYYELTGYNADEVTPNFEFFKRIMHPDDLPQVMEIMEAHMNGKTPASEFDYRLITPSGQFIWMRGRGRVVERDAEGIPLRMVGTITDMSKSKIIEESLRRQTEELVQRNAELERFNRLTVGRELDMIDLKKQVNALSVKLGLESPYDLRFLDLTSSSKSPPGGQA